jgi:hypothetical protein
MAMTTRNNNLMVPVKTSNEANSLDNSQYPFIGLEIARGGWIYQAYFDLQCVEQNQAQRNA